MNFIAHAYTSNRECSVQECIYHVLPKQWLKKKLQVLILQIAIFQKNLLEFIYLFKRERRF